MPAAPLPPLFPPAEALRAAASTLAAALRALVRAQARAEIDRRAAAAAVLARQTASAADARRRVEAHHRAVKRGVSALVGRLDSTTGPFEPSMSVDAAWSRHPRAREAFARRQLPACDRCAVRFDETLEEAAAAYGFDLVVLLDELNALLPDHLRPPQDS